MNIVSKKPILSQDISSLYTSSLEKIKLFVGLGNPGEKYALNRHNIGFMCLDRLAKLYEVPWQNKKDFESYFAQIDLSGTRILLIKPQTYVNLSGQAVTKTIQFYKLPPEDVYIIHDEIRNPFGTIEVFLGQNSFGHNGLKSIQNSIKGELQLIRVGIGPKEPEQIDLTDFVLADFTKKQLESLPAITKEVCSIIGESSSGNLRPEKRSVL